MGSSFNKGSRKEEVIMFHRLQIVEGSWGETEFYFDS